MLVPQVEARVRRDAAQCLGLTPGDIRRAATTLIKGAQVGEIYEDQKIFDVVVWGEEKLRPDLAALREVQIDTPLEICASADEPHRIESSARWQ